MKKKLFIVIIIIFTLLLSFAVSVSAQKNNTIYKAYFETDSCDIVLLHIVTTRRTAKRYTKDFSKIFKELEANVIAYDALIGRKEYWL